MTIEIANRLVKLRKEKGLSQEELADKLGLSRQAVSKWERAEASPDTDNLICLAKLYGVSLDDLLNTDDSIETIVEEQVKDESEQQTTDQEAGNSTKKTCSYEKKDDTIILTDNDGKSIEISDGKFVAKDAKGNVVKEKNFHKTEKTKMHKIADIIEPCLFILATIAYILLGSLCNMWYNGWVVFFIPEIIASIFRAIGKKRFSEFNMAFVCTFAFFFVCMVIPGLSACLWHPMWVVFLGIPLYYSITGTVDHFIHKEDEFEKHECKCVGECDCTKHEDNKD